MQRQRRQIKAGDRVRNAEGRAGRVDAVLFRLRLVIVRWDGSARDSYATPEELRYAGGEECEQLGHLRPTESAPPYSCARCGALAPGGYVPTVAH